MRFDAPWRWLSLLVLLAPATVPATPANKAALSQAFGDLFPARLDNCATCHVRSHADGAETLEDFPHNPFGDSLAKLGADRSLEIRLATIATEDSDGDGVGNHDEILAGSRPGDRSVTASPGPETLAAFTKFEQRYRWRPFEPVVLPAVPDVATSWVRQPIDAFVASEHEARGLVPRPEAPRETWLRRVTIDLTGLAPTPDEIRAFLADDSDNAHEAVVDRLLDSPRYGERWGRHWMDVWRYSDWTGYKAELRESARHIWHWRDWIVEALNDDLGYDEMIRQMMAADELYPGDEDRLRATGYLARNYHRNRDQWMDDVVTHTSQAFLGLTLGCSKCHDHMYDPLPQRDYFAMRAIFEPYQVRTDRVPGELDVMKVGLPRAYDASIESKTYLLERGDERFPVKDEVIPPGPPPSLGGKMTIETVNLPTEAFQPWRRDFVKKELLAARDQELAEATAAREGLDDQADEGKREAARLRVEAAEGKRAALLAEFAVESLEANGEKNSDAWKAAALETFEAQRAAALAAARSQLASAERDKATAESSLAEAKSQKDSTAQAAASKAMTRAETAITTARKSLAAAEKRMKEDASTAFKPRQNDYPNRSTGRRTAFAAWLTETRNPLTARVAMNQVWMRHFQHGIVPTPNEFGANGRGPTHPALLDWLAAEFMDQGWSMKAMHRQIVLSATYRQDGKPEPRNQAIDPDNTYLWRMPSRRMEGEIVRDNLLWVAGRLDETRGGPDIPNTEAQESQRRSLYLRHAHEKLVPFVQIFDGPKVTECYIRHESVQPHQALALHNSPLTHLAAEKLATDLAATGAGFLDEAFLRLLGRGPTAEERITCASFLETEEGESARIRERFLTVLLNHNDFVTIR